MVGSCAMLLESCQVSGSTVAFMLIEAVSGIFLVQLEHQVVACDFCDHRSRRDRQAASIALNERALRERDIAQSKGIEQECLGSGRKLSKCVFHGLFGGL